MQTFTKKIVIVTGASSGIGAATARAFAQQGAQVIGFDLSDSSETAKAIAADGGTFYVAQGDVSQEKDWQSVTALADTIGGTDVLVNIAGFSALHDQPDQLSVADWQKIIDINLKGQWLGIKHAVASMRNKQTGAIINMSSATSLVGVPNHAGYSMAKGGVDALTRQTAVEFANDNIRVNAVCPGPVRTPMMATNSEEAMQQIVDAVPLKRIAEPEEIAELIKFLASPSASSITGVVLPVDGGMTIAM